MATPETQYKLRCKKFLKDLAKRAALKYWMTSLGYGAVSGMPDQWHQFGTVPVLFENKRKSKKASKLQEHKIQVLRQSGFIAFCESAEPQSTGVNGEERQKIIKAMLAQLQDNDVLARAEKYIEDCYTLKTQLEKELR